MAGGEGEMRNLRKEPEIKGFGSPLERMGSPWTFSDIEMMSDCCFGQGIDGSQTGVC